MSDLPRKILLVQAESPKPFLMTNSLEMFNFIKSRFSIDLLPVFFTKSSIPFLDTFDDSFQENEILRNFAEVISVEIIKSKGNEDVFGASSLVKEFKELTGGDNWYADE